MTTLERPLKARRVGRLEKPAPLKRSLSLNTEPVVEEKTENSLSGLSSRRLAQKKSLKLVKPRPLKKKSDDVSPTETTEAPFTEQLTINRTVSLPSNTSLLDNASRSTYNSQTSRDSGIGDMEQVDNRASHLTSVGEDEVFSPEPVDHNANRFPQQSGSNHSLEDDMDWNDLDEPSEPFVFGHQQLKYTSFAVSQAVPFNSFMEKGSSMPLKTVGRGRGRGSARNQIRKATPQNTQYVRSQSVPGSLSQFKKFRTNDNDNDDDWEPAVDNSKVNKVCAISTSWDDLNNNNCRHEGLNKSVKQTSFPGNLNKCVFSEDWENDLIVTGADTGNVQKCVSDESVSKKDLKDAHLRLGEPTYNAVYDNSIQNPTYQRKSTGQKRMLTSEPADSYKCDRDLEATPKASDRLTQLNNPSCVQTCSSMLPPSGYKSAYSTSIPPVQNSNIPTAENQGQNSGSSTRSSTPVNVNPQDCVITPVKDPWEVFQKSANENTLSGMSYRNKRLEYDTCSSDSRSKVSDTDSMTTDDGVNVQEQAWELMDDLTDKLQEFALDTGSSKRSSVSEAENNAIPVDSYQSREQKTDEIGVDAKDNDVGPDDGGSKMKSDSEVQRWKPAGGKRLLVIRDPLTPNSMLQEIWEVEQMMPSGMYSAKGRRKMFRNYAICRDHETVTDEATMIQYSADELLQLGISPLSRQQPDTWSYLTAIYPDICLKEVTDFFNVERYREEREYVVENYLVKDIAKPSTMRHGSLTDNSGRQGTGKPAGFQGFGRSISMPTETQSSLENLSSTEDQSECFTQHRGFGQPNQRGTRPRGFGSPDDIGMGTKPRGFGSPDDVGTRPRGFGSPDDIGMGTKPRGFGSPDDVGTKPRGFGSPDDIGMGTKPRGFGSPDDMGTRPRGFGSPDDIGMGTKPRGFGAPPQKETVKKTVFGSSDLDTKCDISVRSNGLSKIFSGSGGIMGTGYLNLNGGETENACDTEKSCSFGQKQQNYSELLSSLNRRGSTSSEEEYYMNRNLPEKCPW